MPPTSYTSRVYWVRTRSLSHRPALAEVLPAMTALKCHCRQYSSTLGCDHDMASKLSTPTQQKTAQAVV